jgi:hypothetical protein
MNIVNICFGVLAVLITMVALFQIYRLHAAQPQVAGYGSQTMCPSCGSITARSKEHCLHCGEPLRVQ